ncbi:T9SS type A sorting domain-containing protein, partial [Fluviicola sp.]|uniref:T9SS type A sorting domain-containing protein n=1 Tax=Fluviicola sp. TaxID=1917219 RepID=UPI0028287FF8
PSTGLVYIESTFDTGSFDLNVMDVNGRTVLVNTNSISMGTNTVDLNQVEKGIYFFKLSTGNAQKVFRVVIQ